MRRHRPKRTTAARRATGALRVTELAVPRDLDTLDLAHFNPRQPRDWRGRWIEESLGFHTSADESTLYRMIPSVSPMTSSNVVGDLAATFMDRSKPDRERKAAALMWYRTQGFKSVNRAMRGQKPYSGEDREAESLIWAAASDPEFSVEAPEDIVMWRGSTGDLHDKAFVSMTTTRDLAAGRAAMGGRLLEVRVLKGTRLIRGSSDQQEFIGLPDDPGLVEVETPMSLAKAAVAGGFTLHVSDMSATKHGIVVARPGTTFAPADNVKVAARKIREFLDAHPEAEYIGGWYDDQDHIVHLDVVDILHDREQARRLGSERNQKAIFDLDTMTEIDTGGTGDPQARADLSTRELGRDDRGREDRVVRADRSGDGRARTVDLAHHFDPHELRDAHGRWALTGREAAALVSWTSKRGGTRRIQKNEAFKESFTSALAKLPETKGPLYRGVKGTGADRHAALNVGDVVDWTEPKSVSTDVHKAFAFGTNVYEIEGSARSLAGHSKFAYEHEAVLPPGKFRVTGRQMRKVYGTNVSVVRLKEIADVGLAHHFDPHEPRNAKGEWTKDETRAWLGRHPVKAANVVDLWDQGTKGEHEAGERWYPEAHKVALALGKRYGVSTEEAAGLLATYSPQTPWGQNVRFAAEALREHRALGGPGEKIWWHRDPSTPNTVEEREGVMAPGTAKARAERIMAGESPEEVFAGRNKNGTLKPQSLKIRAFFELIANGESDPARPAVVIDRHAAGVARGVRFTDEDYNVESPSGSAKRLKPYVEAYRRAALVLSKREGRKITPEMVQAATWLTRQRLNGQMESAVGRTRKSLGGRDTKMLYAYASQYLPEALAEIPQVGYGELANLTPDAIDLAHPSIGRTRRITRQLLDGEDPVDLLTQRGVYQPVAEAVAKMVGGGTAHRPNARRAGHPLTLPVRFERDREALYRGAYLLKASERVETRIEEGDSLKEAMAKERRFHAAHEEARRNRLEAVVRAQKVASLYGEPVETRGTHRTLVGWYLNPLLNNDPECEAADGHNFYAEEGTVIGFPGAVHNNCGCVAGPPIEGAGMVNDAVRGVVPITHISSRPKFAAKRKARMSA